ncbi:hypothetical protein GCG54_00007500 [Colletotrichum gloeosporioides]|uniref:Ankyrin repeat protein n=1 Tax=Colletotrichum gloeosporioides TaxID=474922 RepID=A0A8H4FMN4_COLGL|nr:uncharacterized protein GCG54_00007500 [Colletotrichum gloeosporioides]KAF3807767.1 hypothetical protein GCG54_00007500 [Colletotrichum gloeosporioides]
MEAVGAAAAIAQLAGLSLTAGKLARINLSVAVRDSSTAPKATRERTKLNMPSKQLKSENDPGYMLMQHSMRATQRYTIASTGNSGHPAISSNAFYSIGGSLTVDSRLKSRKAKFLFNLAFRLLGQYILRVEIQAQLLCRFWKLNPSLTGSLWVVNMRPGDAPIFSACRSWNLEEVHYLLNTGQASINDADNETGGLLEHVILGRLPGTDRAAVRETDFLRGGQALLEYLLEQGCDPSITHLRAEKALPAVLSAFSLGYRNATSTMISHGADINSFGNMVGGLFESVGTSTSQLLWKFRLLQSMGYSDWRLDTPSNHLLYGACWGKQLDLSLFALEIASLDPNQPGELGRTPLGNAAQSRWLEGISILIQYGARVNVREGPWDESPLGRSIALSHILTDASHYLLLKGADPGLQDSTGLSLWAHMMTKQYDPEYGWYLKFSYIAFEGSVAHLLHHGSNPFEIFDGDEKSPREYDVSRWFALIGHLQASDIARFRSYGMSRRKNLFAESFNGFLPAGLLQSIEAMDSRRCFDWTFRWDIGGEISWDHNISSATKAFEEERLSRVPREEQERGFYATDVVEEWGSEYDSDDYITDEGNFVPIWEHADPRHQDYTDVMYGGNPEFFRNATGFYRHIATAHGRRQLSRWPTVRALCDALQHAGYRVEMDDEGDLWYDCDDGDRYFDAWERQSAQVRDDWLVNTCPICQNLEKYGLGHILETKMKAKEKISEYRRQAREGKRRYF